MYALVFGVLICSFIFMVLACTAIHSFVFTFISIVLFLIDVLLSFRTLKYIHSNPEKATQGIPIKIGKKVIELSYLGFVLYMLFKLW
jgi:hypothetical protein